MAAAEAASQGLPNNLLERLAVEPAFASVPAATLQAELDPQRYTGRSARQVSEFLDDYLAPLLARARPAAAQPEPMELFV